MCPDEGNSQVITMLVKGGKDKVFKGALILINEVKINSELGIK